VGTLRSSQQRKGAEVVELEVGPLFLLKNNIESSVKLGFAVMEYNSIEFKCLPPDTCFGSSEFLLAVDRLLLTSDVSEGAMSRKLRECQYVKIIKHILCLTETNCKLIIVRQFYNTTGCPVQNMF
jgi:hypothetical protein